MIRNRMNSIKRQAVLSAERPTASNLYLFAAPWSTLEHRSTIRLAFQYPGAGPVESPQSNRHAMPCHAMPCGRHWFCMLLRTDLAWPVRVRECKH
jgi:hypothetical protein